MVYLFKKILNFIKLVLLSLILLFIKFYQKVISPILLPRCRFYPTCSNYAKEAIEKHGLFGVWLSAKRISKCHPFYKGKYYDPV